MESSFQPKRKQHSVTTVCGNR